MSYLIQLGNELRVTRKNGTYWPLDFTSADEARRFGEHLALVIRDLVNEALTNSLTQVWK